MHPLPSPGSIIHCRARRYLVEDVVRRAHVGEYTLVRLVCIDDDAQGQPLEVLWEREIDAVPVSGASWQSVVAKGFDNPRWFSAFSHTVRWSCFTSADSKLFQAPYRAGIEVKAYQLEPLRKALLMPRGEPDHRRRCGPGQDHRGRAHPARAGRGAENLPGCEDAALEGAQRAPHQAAGAQGLRPAGRDEKPSTPSAFPGPTLWGIPSGRTGDAGRLFVERDVALGWAKLGDLGELAAAYPEKRPGAIPDNAGQLFRVFHEMAVGDLVAYSSSPTQQAPLRRVTGDDVIELGSHAYQAHQRAAHMKRTNPSAQ